MSTFNGVFQRTVRYLQEHISVLERLYPSVDFFQSSDFLWSIIEVLGCTPEEREYRAYVKDELLYALKRGKRRQLKYYKRKQRIAELENAVVELRSGIEKAKSHLPHLKLVCKYYATKVQLHQFMLQWMKRTFGFDELVAELLKSYDL